MRETSSLPLPPDELIDRVVTGFSNERADEHRAMFLETGHNSLHDLERALTAVGDTLSGHERILEFGCGCGRIMRWMEELGRTRTLVGTDIDARAVEWASENLPFARFDVNDGVPPTRYRDGEFDLVVNHSVFTHLDEHYQDLWLAELERITAPGGLLVLSIHGEHAYQVSEQHLETDSPLRREWRAKLERDGILYIAEDTYVGSAFPDFYHTTFHAPWYVFEHWSRWFDVLAYLPRSSLEFQDQLCFAAATIRGTAPRSERDRPMERTRRMGHLRSPPPPTWVGRWRCPPMPAVLARLACLHGARYFAWRGPFCTPSRMWTARSLMPFPRSTLASTSACRQLCTQRFDSRPSAWSGSRGAPRVTHDAERRSKQAELIVRSATNRFTRTRLNRGPRCRRRPSFPVGRERAASGRSQVKRSSTRSRARRPISRHRR